MIKVLFLIPTLDKGGAENVLVNLVNNMDQSIFDITVQTLFDQDSQKDNLKVGIKYKSFLKHQFYGNSRIFSIIPAKLLYKTIIKEKYDVIVSYLEGPTSYIISGCPFKSTKKVAWIHVELNDKDCKVGFRSYISAVQTYKKFDKVVCVSKTVMDSVNRVTNHELSNICVLYNTVDAEGIKRKSEEDVLDLQLKPDEVNIFSIGRVIPQKGYDRLARAMYEIVSGKERKYGDPHVYILGKGAQQEEIVSYIKEKQIDDRFTFLGFKENPYNYLSKADLFVCSSRKEGFSTAVTEALILGIPVLSTCCSGAHELLGDNNEYGVVVENSEQGIRIGLENMLKDRKFEEYRYLSKKRGETFLPEQTTKAVERMLIDLCMN